jgi:undecaprenyl-diphosphatase
MSNKGPREPSRSRRESRANLSVPSGHSTAASGVCGILGYILAREGVVSPAGGAALAIVPAMIVGGSRVYLGEHWASDVLAGWATGLGVAAASAASYEAQRKRLARRSI